MQTFEHVSVQHISVLARCNQARGQINWATHCGVELLGGIGCSVDDFGDEGANEQPATANETVEKFDGKFDE